MEILINIFLSSKKSGTRSNKTVKPRKDAPTAGNGGGTQVGGHQQQQQQGYDLVKYAATTLGSGNLRLAVMLPEGEDLNEWVAVNSESSFAVVEMKIYYVITRLLLLLLL